MKTTNSYFVDSSNISSSGHIIIIMSQPEVPIPNSGLQLWIDGNGPAKAGPNDTGEEEIVLKKLSLIVDNIYIRDLIYEPVLPHIEGFEPNFPSYFGMVGETKSSWLTPQSNVGLYFRGPSKEWLPKDWQNTKLLDLGVIYLQNMGLAMGVHEDTYIYVTPDKHDSQPFSLHFMNENVFPMRNNEILPDASLYKIIGLVAKDGVVNWDVYELKQLLTGSKYK